MPDASQSASSQNRYSASPVASPYYYDAQDQASAIAVTMQSSMNPQNMSQGLPPSPYGGGPVQPLYQQAMPQPQRPSLRPSSGAWSPGDDEMLMKARAQGLNWAPIQSKYFPTKTPNACRKRHERLMDRRNSDDWDILKLENLAKEYMGMRKEIWSQLGAKTNEKWNVVEAKCMNSGFKNLSSHARSAARRERLVATPSSSGLMPVLDQHGGYGDPHTDDSGIGLEEQEAEYYHHGRGHSHHHANTHPHSTESGSGSYGPPSGSLSLSPAEDQTHKLYANQASPGLSISRGDYGYAPQQQQQQQQLLDPRASGRELIDRNGYSRGVDRGYVPQQSQAYAMQNRLPSIDMGIGAIINPSRGNR